MIGGMLDKDSIQVIESVSTWEEAIRISVEPLIKGGYVEKRYYDAIIEATKRHGPYYVLAPNIAMPHANYNDGVISKHMSLTILKTPIRFSESSFEVRLIFTLAAEDKEGHLNALMTLAYLFQNEDLINALMHVNTKEEAIQILESI